MSGDGRAYGGWGKARQPGLPTRAANISDYGMAKPDPAREARLAAALRDNLRRRKAQSRATDEQDNPDRPERSPEEA